MVDHEVKDGVRLCADPEAWCMPDGCIPIRFNMCTKFMVGDNAGLLQSVNSFYSFDSYHSILINDVLQFLLPNNFLRDNADWDTRPLRDKEGRYSSKNWKCPESDIWL